MGARPISKLYSFFALTLLLVACKGQPASGGPYVWIDVPTDGLQVEPDRAVRIEGHASYGGGIARVEIRVNGEPHLVQEDLSVRGNLAHFDQMWMPPGVGEYVVEVKAIGTDGTESVPDSVRLYVGEAAAEAEPTATPPPTLEGVTEPTAVVTPTLAATEVPEPTATLPPPTLTPTLPPPTIAAAVIEFWADAEQVNAGSCTILHWRVENVQAVFLDGNGVAGTGSSETCPCQDEVHTLIVTRLDGEQEQRQITVRVTGTCVVPTIKPTVPPPDNTPPPAPKLVSPEHEQSLACVSKVMLDWDPVSDPSPISEYQIEVQRAPVGVNWKPVDDSPWTGVGATKLQIDVECGWYYRWRVRAVDGVGNVGAYSGWFVFVLPLG
jgi:hypothetical protein